MDILATVAIAALTMLGIVVPAFFVFRAQVRKETADEKAARVTRLDAVDDVLWTRLQDALEEEREENSRNCASIMARVAALEIELDQEQEARRALAAASDVDRRRLIERVTTLENDLRLALEEVAVLRHKNAELEAQLHSKQNKIL